MTSFFFVLYIFFNLDSYKHLILSQIIIILIISNTKIITTKKNTKKKIIIFAM